MRARCLISPQCCLNRSFTPRTDTALEQVEYARHSPAVTIRKRVSGLPYQVLQRWWWCHTTHTRNCTPSRTKSSPMASTWHIGTNQSSPNRIAGPAVTGAASRHCLHTPPARTRSTPGRYRRTTSQSSAGGPCCCMLVVGWLCSQRGTFLERVCTGAERSGPAGPSVHNTTKQDEQVRRTRCSLL